MPASDFVKIQRLHWAGHVVRMDENRIPKRVLQSKWIGIRPKEKPRKRWEDSVTENVRMRMEAGN